MFELYILLLNDNIFFRLPNNLVFKKYLSNLVQQGLLNFTCIYQFLAQLNFSDVYVHYGSTCYSDFTKTYLI